MGALFDQLSLLDPKQGNQNWNYYNYNFIGQIKMGIITIKMYLSITIKMNLSKLVIALSWTYFIADDHRVNCFIWPTRITPIPQTLWVRIVPCGDMGWSLIMFFVILSDQWRRMPSPYLCWRIMELLPPLLSSPLLLGKIQNVLVGPGRLTLWAIIEPQI